jgi:hypothetical protein
MGSVAVAVAAAAFAAVASVAVGPDRTVAKASIRSLPCCHAAFAALTAGSRATEDSSRSCQFASFIVEPSSLHIASANPSASSFSSDLLAAGLLDLART